MPPIIPIRDLKNTSEVSSLCHSSKEPIFVTKNGYGDMVIMSMETYERSMFLIDAQLKIREAERQIEEGKGISAKDTLSRLSEKYGL